MRVSSEETAYGDPVTRRRILDVTRDLVETHGSGVRLRDVAAGAGVSRQAVYLHFRDRAGLMLALVDHIDAQHAAEQVGAEVRAAPSGAEALRRWVALLARYTGAIDRVAEVLERAQDDDEALGAAWRDRMARRRRMAGSIVRRIAEEGDLDPAWSVAEAADLAYALTMPGPWRVLTRERGWDTDQVGERLFDLLRGSILRTPGDAPT